MWQIINIQGSMVRGLWFSDGQPIDERRGGYGACSRLIVEGQGFIDFTDLQSDLPRHADSFIDVNGLTVECSSDTVVPLFLTFPLGGGFSISVAGVGPAMRGQFKPLPQVAADDAGYLERMILERYVPYQNLPDAPGKSDAEIKALGRQLFPFSPYSDQLAMAAYDWTTASFTRLVLMKIFEYTGADSLPLPLDQGSIAATIWASDWGSYTPQNVDYMRSFLMDPAPSLESVQTQLAQVAVELQQFSNIENRLLQAAFQAMPRTSVVSQPQLFSGQVDIAQLGMQHFGIEFLQCPLNAGPTDTPLQIPLLEALDTYIRPGQTITTKMIWSFGDLLTEAMKYENGILLVAHPPAGARVWETVSYITPLSDDTSKEEFTFAPGTCFLVEEVYQSVVQGKEVWVIKLQAGA